MMVPVSAPGDWRSRMNGTVTQQACEVTQLHQTITKIAIMLEAHAVWEDAQWLGTKNGCRIQRRSGMSTTWNAYYEVAVIVDMTSMVLCNARLRKAVLTQEERKEDRDGTARHTSLYAGARLGSEPEKHQLQQQPKPKPKPKPKLQVKQQSE